MASGKIIRGVFNKLINKLGTKTAKKAASKKIKSKIITAGQTSVARASKKAAGSVLTPGGKIRAARAAAKKAGAEGKGSIGRARRRASIRVKANDAERATQLSGRKRGAEVAERQAGKNVISLKDKRIEKELDKLQLKGDSRARVRKLMQSKKSQSDVDKDLKKVFKKFTRGK